MRFEGNPMLTTLHRLTMIAALLLAAPAMAEERVVRIGVLGDMSGFASQVGGPGAVLATRMAVQDHGGTAAGMPIEVVEADMQNKPDIAAQIARRWFDVDSVDAIADLPVTPVALAVQGIARDKKKVLLISEAATTELTGGSARLIRPIGPTTPTRSRRARRGRSSR